MNGILIVDKPEGWTSHDVVGRVRRLLKTRRVGHTGTLDPFATGVLVVLVGQATRLAQYLAGAEKEYVATVRFGFATDTGDLTGARLNQEIPIDKRLATELSVGAVEGALESLRGEIEQTPPMYSAKKIAGVKLYELARRGETIERQPVVIKIKELELLNANEDAEGMAYLQVNEDATCDVRVRVVCSAGTYVRVLAEQIAARLDTRAHLVALRRTRAGEFTLAQSVTLGELDEAASRNEDVAANLLPLQSAVSGLSRIRLSAEDRARALNGVSIMANKMTSARFVNDDETGRDYEDDEAVALFDEGDALIAIARYDAATASFRPRTVLYAHETS